MTTATPWRYLFTASQTELGKNEEWFWNATPRIVDTMLAEKKRIDVAKLKTAAYLNLGGELDEDDDGSVPGIDRPASDSDIAFLIAE